MSEMNDGGPAFPLPEARDANGCGIYEAQGGMSMRDWFAGKALIGSMYLLAADDELLGMSLPEMAAHSYRIADAMLAERAKATQP